MIALPGMMPFSQDELYLTYANDSQLDFVPTFYKLAYDQFEGRIRVHSATNTHGLTNIDPAPHPVTRKGYRFHHRGADAPRRVNRKPLIFLRQRIRLSCAAQMLI